MKKDSKNLIELLEYYKKYKFLSIGVIILSLAYAGISLLSPIYEGKMLGYFENFVSLICESLNLLNQLEVKGKKYKKFQFNIIIPKDLDADIKKRAKIYFKNKSLEEIEIPSSSRSYPIHIQFDDDSIEETLQLYDMPTTIGGIDKAIEMYMRKGHIGKTEQQKLLEERELRNFQTTLENLIANDAFTKEMVKVIYEV